MQRFESRRPSSQSTLRSPKDAPALLADDLFGHSLGDRVKGGAIGEGCGHFLPSECPDELAAAILAFWRETGPP
jgi:pimeloyl-ACP methyl ester carboxylesterase